MDNMSLNIIKIKKEPSEAIDNSSLTEKISLSMTDGSLKNNMHISGEEQFFEAFGNYMSVNKTNMNEESVLHADPSNIVPKNIKKEIIDTSYETTENVTYVHLKVEIEESSESLDSPFSFVVGSENDKKSLNFENNIIIREEISEKECYMAKKNILNSTNTSSSHSPPNMVNSNCDETVSVNNSDLLKNLNSTNSLASQKVHKNHTLTNDDASNTTFILLPNVPCFSVNKQDQNFKNCAKNMLPVNSVHNFQCLPESLPKDPAFHHSSNIKKSKKIWEIRDKNIVLRGINNATLKKHLSMTSGKPSFVRKTLLYKERIGRKSLIEHPRHLRQICPKTDVT